MDSVKIHLHLELIVSCEKPSPIRVLFRLILNQVIDFFLVQLLKHCKNILSLVSSRGRNCHIAHRIRHWLNRI